jgi:hypothetical protein
MTEAEDILGCAKVAVQAPIRTPNEELVLAIGQARLEFDPLDKSAKGMIGQRTFNYVPLGDMVAAIEKALAKHGVSFVMPMAVGPERASVELIVRGHGGCFHTEASCRVPGPEDLGRGGKELGDTWIQELGRVTTYLRRYLLNSFFALDTVEDKESEGAGVEARPMRQRDERAETPAQRERKAAPKAEEKGQEPPEDEVKSRFKAARAALGWDADAIRKVIADNFDGKALADLNPRQRLELVEILETLVAASQEQEEPGAAG